MSSLIILSLLNMLSELHTVYPEPFHVLTLKIVSQVVWMLKEPKHLRHQNERRGTDMGGKSLQLEPAERNSQNAP